MIADSFREQLLRVWQSKDLFRESVKRGFAQILRLRCDALNRSTAGDEPMHPLAPFSPFVVGGAVFETLDFVVFLRKLTLDLFFLSLQFLNFFFVHDFSLLTDIKMDTKRPPTFSVDGLGNDMDFQALRRKWSAPADGFRCKVRWDRRASVARGAAPCSEQSDAKQPGQ
jgi:hypothetical protein